MILRIDRKTIYMYVQKGLIPCVRIQSNIGFDRREIFEWIGSTVFHRWDADDVEACDMPARKTATQSKTSPLMINVFDGTRQPFPVGTDILYRVIDGNRKQVSLPSSSPRRFPAASTSCLFPMMDNLTSPRLAGIGSNQICLFSPTESTTRLDGLATKI